MTKSNTFFQTLKPGIPKSYLIFVAAIVWTFAGGMLLYRGFSMLIPDTELLWVKLTGSFIVGIIFFVYTFSNISLKHILRIVNLQQDRPCFFSFFNWKSYLMMVIMMSFGITLRMTGIVSPKYLSIFYIAMGTPLFLSAFRFYFYGIYYQKTVKKRS
ncbi:MAG TPA: hypothetical protein VIK55_04230 [Paludibacter sp.]